jgi:hypothetical protein
MIEYLEGNEERLFSIYGRQRFPGDAHLWGFNGRRLERMLRDTGFVDVRRGEPTDAHVAEEPCMRFEACKPDSPHGKVDHAG